MAVRDRRNLSGVTPSNGLMTKCTVLLVVTGLLLGGCKRDLAAERDPRSAAAATPSSASAARSDRDPAAGRDPLAAEGATPPSLQAVAIRYGNYLARIEHRITIAPNGWLRSASTHNKRYAPRDGNWQERWEVREGQLTPRQVVEVAALFNGWSSLSTQPHHGVPDGPEFEVRYGGHVVSGGNAPSQAWDAYRRIRELAERMPVVRSDAVDGGPTTKERSVDKYAT
jgi:hypothetical protein